MLLNIAREIEYKIANNDTSLSDMLKAFYAQFDQNTISIVTPALTAPDTPVPPVTASDTRSVFLGVNPRKVTGPDSAPSRVLRCCVDQLAEIFTDIFYLSPPTNRSTHLLQEDHHHPRTKENTMCLNDYRPIALTSIIMKCFKMLVMAHINSSLPACLAPL
eukprot:g22015.t1